MNSSSLTAEEILQGWFKLKAAIKTLRESGKARNKKISTLTIQLNKANQLNLNLLEELENNKQSNTAKLLQILPTQSSQSISNEKNSLACNQEVQEDKLAEIIICAEESRVSPHHLSKTSASAPQDKNISTAASFTQLQKTIQQNNDAVIINSSESIAEEKTSSEDLIMNLAKIEVFKVIIKNPKLKGETTHQYLSNTFITERYYQEQKKLNTSSDWDYILTGLGCIFGATALTFGIYGFVGSLSVLASISIAAASIIADDILVLIASIGPITNTDNQPSQKITPSLSSFVSTAKVANTSHSFLLGQNKNSIKKSNIGYSNVPYSEPRVSKCHRI